MNILLSIDGTGVDSDAQYAREMAHSHVRKSWWRSPIDGASKRYMRGPTMLGMKMVDIVTSGCQFCSTGIESSAAIDGR